MALTIGSKTDPGRRPNNEDHFIVVDTKGMALDALVIVADGMGGRNFGERASAAGAEEVERTCRELLPSTGAPINIASAMGVALRRANECVYRLSQEDQESEGMGTTCVAAAVANGRLTIAHAGDSRAYVIRDGFVEQITDDHSFVAEQVRAGLITEDHARKSRFRNVITRAVGIEPTIEPDVVEVPIGTIQAILLCTDGLSGSVGDTDIEKILLRAETAQEAADALVSLAVRSGAQDNITAVVAKLTDGAIRPASGEEADEDYDEAPMRGASTSLFLQNALLAMMVFFVCTTVFLTLRIVDAGYTWKWSSPFLVAPPVPVPQVPDHSRDSFAAPVEVGFTPLQTGLLAIDPEFGTLTALGTDGQALRMSPDGSVLTRFKLDHRLGNVGNGTNMHFTTDPSGDLIVANAADKTVIRYRRNGQSLGDVSSGMLIKPGAVAVDQRGDIYVIDNGRLKILRVQRGA